MPAGFTNEGLNHLIATEFCGGPQVTGWCLGLINNAAPGTGLPLTSAAFSSSDTMASHPGWAEALFGGVVYAGNRPPWGNGGASGQQTTNSGTVNYGILATVTIYGLFLASLNGSTGANLGTLGATAVFSTGPQAVNNGATLQTILTVSAISG